MSNDKTGGPAFPVWELNGQGKAEMTDFGMTLRDYFAAKAMQGLVSVVDGEGWIENSVTAAYKIADAMLEARK